MCFKQALGLATHTCIPAEHKPHQAVPAHRHVFQAACDRLAEPSRDMLRREISHCQPEDTASAQGVPLPGS